MQRIDDPRWVKEGLSFWEGQLNKAIQNGKKKEIQRARWEYGQYLYHARRLNLV